MQPAEVYQAGNALSASLRDVVKTHPWLSSGGRILPVPGHDSQAPASAGLRIGHTLSHMLGLDLVTVGARNQYRRTAKAMTSEERAMLLDEFTVAADLSGRTVLVVDDVYRTGCTMAGVARAARQAGATTVLGLVTARALRRDAPDLGRE